MAIYTVYLPPRDDVLTGAERAVFQRDDFSILAFALPLPWLLWHRMWLVLAIYLGLSAVVNLGFVLSGNVAGAVIGNTLLSLWLGFEARGLRGWTLLRRGWSITAVIDAADAETAEIRYFSRLADRLVLPPAPPSATPDGARAAPGPVIGLFPAAGGRA